MGLTKNKYLRRLVRNYEIELQRPKGCKMLDLLIRNIPDGLGGNTLFVGRTIHKECDFITRYKGIEVRSAIGLKGTSLVYANPSNLYFQ